MKKTILKMVSYIIAIITLISTFSFGSISASAATSSNIVQEIKCVTIQNLKNGQYINVDYGVLKNGQPVRIWPFDGSSEQQFSIKKVSNNVYRIVTAKSSNYSLDIYRGNSKLKKGQLCNIWKAGSDDYAQNIKFYRCNDGSFILCMAENTNLVLSAPDKKGRVKLATFNKSDKAQRWVFKDKKGNKIDITSSSSSVSTDNKALASTNTSDAVLKNWNANVGKTIANIKEGKSYTKWYGSKNISAKAGYTGECTWYAYGRFYETTGIALKYANNAKRWLKDNANDNRVKILKGANKIVPQCIAVDTSGTYGHVMFIEYVEYNAKGNPQTVFFTESNWDCNSTYNVGKDCVVKKLSYSQFVAQRGPDGYIIVK